LYKKEKFTPYKQHYCCPDLAIQTLLPTFSNLLFMLLGKKSSEALNQQALKNTSPTIYKLNAMNMMQPK
jgi:hypothetical protein